MAPSQNYVLNTIPLEPVSRTYQYRKVMKPMLERKRRARINRCLDELKELMAVALQSEGENVAKLEKADILELTVRHLQTLKEQNSLYVKSSSSSATTIQKTDKLMNDENFWYGFRHCANEVSQYLLRFDHKAGIDFLRYIKDYMPTTNLDKNCISTTLQNQHQLNNTKQQYFTTNNTTTTAAAAASAAVNASTTRQNTMSMYSTVNAMSHFQSTYNRYHQDDISFLMYRNKIYAQNLNIMPAAMMINNNHIIENGCSINKDSKDSLLSDVSLDDDITVWRPW